MKVKAVILIAGPQKGTRFRPLSLDVPKPLFPVAGLPLIQHHIEAAAKVKQVDEILILGCYTNAEMADFVLEMNQQYQVPVKYLQEYTSLGTAGGMYHFRDRILSGGETDAFFVLNGDVCADFPLQSMLSFHESHPSTWATIMSTEATRQQAVNYGCVVFSKDENCLVQHYVEKPTTYVSSHINCGVYIFSKDIFQLLQEVYKVKQSDGEDAMWIEKDVLPALASSEDRIARVYQTSNWWSQMKTAGSAIYANRHYLSLYQTAAPQRLFTAEKPQIIGNVFIDPTAKVHPTAVIGPNVSLGPRVTIGAGSRIKESIILSNSSVGDHSLILYTVIGLNSKVGNWTRVEGTPNDPNPNKPFAKMENNPLFNDKGKMNPSITILGSNVEVSSEIVVLNAIVLPHKQIENSFKNEIIL